jgi:hypothetical protein
MWNRDLGPTDEHAVIWLGWTAVGEMDSNRRMVITGRLIQGGNELAENTDPIKSQYLPPFCIYEVNRAFLQFLAGVDARFTANRNPHPLLPSGGLDRLPVPAPAIHESPSQNGRQRPRHQTKSCVRK